MDELEGLWAEQGPRRYWNQRHGEAYGRIDLTTACVLFGSTVSGLQAENLFAEWAGYSCVDGDVSGTAGDDPAEYAFRKTRLRGLWPPHSDWDAWDTTHLMTAIEFFNDVVSAPVLTFYHDYLGCGRHPTTFNRRRGQDRYRAEVNEFLIDFDDGFELGTDGVIIRRVPDGLDDLVAQELPTSAGSSRQETLNHAITVFRARNSSRLDQRDALKALVELLESVRPQLRTAFAKKDESDLFEIANRFNLRHSDPRQRNEYDADIFLPWLFYSYLAAVHAAFRLLERRTD